MYTVTGKHDQKSDMLAKHATMVKKLAYQLKAKLPPSVELDDLIQAGMMGLLDAINRYEDTHGAQFETYAAQRIRGSMLDELRSADWVPRSVRKSMRDIETAIHQLEQQLGRPPSENEIAKKLDVSLQDYYETLGDCQGHQLVYYEDFHDEENGGEHFLDRFLDDASSDPIKGLLESDFRDALIESIEALPEREKILMGLYYEQELNLKEIGAVMSVSESRVCQLHSQAVARLRAHLKRKSMDWGSLAGLAIALLGLLIGQAVEGGQIASLVQPAALLIVLFGTFGAVLLQSNYPTFMAGLVMAKQVFVIPNDDRHELIARINAWAIFARKEGIFMLENFLFRESEPFIRKGLQLMIDGTPPDRIREICAIDMHFYELKQRNAAKIWSAAGGYSPTIGILGAVIGLIHVMENLSDPSRLGSGIAIAFVATIYGVALANLVFLPIANKLKSLINQEMMRREMLLNAWVSIARGDHPKIVDERLQSYLH